MQIHADSLHTHKAFSTAQGAGGRVLRRGPAPGEGPQTRQPAQVPGGDPVEHHPRGQPDPQRGEAQ